MPTRQIKLYAKEASTGKTTTTTINNVNPEATAANMRDFARQLNAFTTNTYEKSDLVETTNLDTTKEG